MVWHVTYSHNFGKKFRIVFWLGKVKGYRLFVITILKKSGTPLVRLLYTILRKLNFSRWSCLTFRYVLSWLSYYERCYSWIFYVVRVRAGERVDHRCFKGSFLASDEFMELLENFKVCTRVSKANASHIIYEIAQQELIQRPHLMASSWKKHFQHFKVSPCFNSPEAVNEFYNKSMATPKKVITLMKAATQRWCWTWFVLLFETIYTRIG